LAGILTCSDWSIFGNGNGNGNGFGVGVGLGVGFGVGLVLGPVWTYRAVDDPTKFLALSVKISSAYSRQSLRDHGKGQAGQFRQLLGTATRTDIL
jgi:hypothetical protein